MDRPVFLKRVMIDNYRSIRHCDVTLGPVSHLIGPNGAGKSNFLDALRLAKEVVTGVSRESAVRRRGGLRSIVHCGTHTLDPHYSIKLGFSGPANSDWDFHYSAGVENGRTSSALLISPGADWDRSSPRKIEERAAEELSSFEIYDIPSDFDDLITEYEANQLLAPDGSNLASVLYRLSREDDGRIAERINDYMRAILPNLVEVRAKSLTYEPEHVADSEYTRLHLSFLQRSLLGEMEMRISQMSAGTVHSLGILTALLQSLARPGLSPALVAIEEPECHVHPAALAVLRDAIDEASHYTQVIVTTQSAYLLDDKDVDPDSILVVESVDGETQISRMSEADRSVVRDRLTTPGELLRSGISGPREARLGRLSDWAGEPNESETLP